MIVSIFADLPTITDLLFRSADFNARCMLGIMMLHLKYSLTASVTLSSFSNVNKLSPTIDKDAELNKKFSFDNGLNKKR